MAAIVRPPRRPPAIRHGYGCGPITPYQAGFEDYRYNRQFTNPYPLGSAEWYQYAAGNADARRQGRCPW